MTNSYPSLLLLCSSLVLAPLGAAAEPLADLLRQASREGQFVQASSDELVHAQKLFVNLAREGKSPALQAEAAALALEILPAEAPNSWVVRETPEAKRGRGLFAFRAGVGSDVLQVPHSFKDEMTREIGLALFAEGRFAAAAWNTVPRTDADMAHREATYFQSFTQAMAELYPQGMVLQIHGFDQGKRKTQAAADVDLILSAGHSAPPASLRQKWRCLMQAFPGQVALYPETARELGGTGNAQGGLLRSLGFNGFVHAEMSRPLRSLLREDRATRAALLACLQAKGGN